MSKIWNKGFDINKDIEQFTVGNDRELDILLAEFDILGSLAHIQMLETIDLLSKDELEKLQETLKNIHQEIKLGNFEIEKDIEDVHSQVELMLTRSLGDVGKKIHSGRSRNDQVLVDIKMYMRNEIQKIVYLSQNLFEVLVTLSEKYQDKLLPGYTHLQIAMPSSFGLWFGAYAESLVDDLTVLQAAYKVVNKNPLGSAAGYGSSFPLNRQMTTDLLGFDSMNYNVVYAQMGRGKTEKTVANAIASIAATMGKMSMDICLYMSQNFGFITFPDELTTGSSIMPHKKNPDVFELIRAKCNKLQALPNEISLIIGNLPSGYQRDLQLIKEDLFPAFEEIKNCLRIASFMLKQVIVKEDILKDEKYKYLFSVEAVNKLVLEGLPFRDAYKKIGKTIEEGSFQPPSEVKHTHEGSIGNLMNDSIQAEMEEVIASFNFDKVTEAYRRLLS